MKTRAKKSVKVIRPHDPTESEKKPFTELLKCADDDRNGAMGEPPEFVSIPALSYWQFQTLKERIIESHEEQRTYLDWLESNPELPKGDRCVTINLDLRLSPTDWAVLAEAAAVQNWHIASVIEDLLQNAVCELMNGEAINAISLERESEDEPKPAALTPPAPAS